MPRLIICAYVFILMCELKSADRHFCEVVENIDVFESCAKIKNHNNPRKIIILCFEIENNNFSDKMSVVSANILLKNLALM